MKGCRKILLLLVAGFMCMGAGPTVMAGEQLDQLGCEQQRETCDYLNRRALAACQLANECRWFWRCDRLIAECESASHAANLFCENYFDLCHSNDS